IVLHRRDGFLVRGGCRTSALIPLRRQLNHPKGGYITPLRRFKVALRALSTSVGQMQEDRKCPIALLRRDL
ncbi:MAG TPA: hypothetical protein VNT27_11685, partial [Propionibacteriaceae bacterium]|nr:hypothetical protein [Propionibacteriaceae bacterium]